MGKPSMPSMPSMRVGLAVTVLFLLMMISWRATRVGNEAGNERFITRKTTLQDTGTGLDGPQLRALNTSRR
jgi:hypothetical protein